MIFRLKERKIKYLVLENSKCPFEEWLCGIKDISLLNIIDARLIRLRDGNFGDFKSVGQGVFELKIMKGGGIRIYYGLEDDEIVILICGGNKNSQFRDIKNARKLWKKYKDEN